MVIFTSLSCIIKHMFQIFSGINDRPILVTRGVTWVSRWGGGGGELILPDKTAWLKMPRPHLVDITHK